MRRFFFYSFSVPPLKTISLHDAQTNVDASNSVNVTVTREKSFDPMESEKHYDENAKISVMGPEDKLPSLEPDTPDIWGNAEKVSSPTVKPVNLVTVLRYPQNSEQPEEETEKGKDDEILTKRKVKKKKSENSGEGKVMRIKRKYVKKDPLEDDKSIGMPSSGETVCPICAEGFDFHEQLEDHVRKTGHYERNWMCKLCNKRFLMLKSVRYHIKFVHEKMTRDHIRCGKEFDPNENYEVNLRETFVQHLEDRLPCGICGKLFKGKCMEFHLKTHENTDWKNRLCRFRKCSHCGLYFATPTGHARHLTQVHNDFFQCELCDEKFYAKLTLKMHKIRIHGEDSNIKCKICDMKFARPDQLRNHMTSHNSSRTEQCKICGKTFKNRASLCAHVNLTHDISLKNIDEAIEQMKNESRNETGDAGEYEPMEFQKRKSEEFLCTICGKVIRGKDKSVLKLHIDRVHYKKYKSAGQQYTCEKCGKRFSSKEYLIYHSERHLMEENLNADFKFKCGVCGKRFQFSSSLVRHRSTAHRKRVHRLIQCSICGVTVQERTMQDHMDNHAGVLNFECEKCGKIFASRGRLYNHRMVHKDVNYECEVCGASYKQKSYLKRHMKNKHSQ